MSRGRSAVMVLVVLAVAWGGLALTLVTNTTPVLGLDLQGGFAVTLAAPEATDKDVLEKAVEIIRNRIESLGNVQEPEVSVSGDRNITVQLPGVTDRERALNAVGATGQLSFRPVLDIGSFPGVSPLFEEALLNAPPPTTAPPTTEGTTTTVEGAAPTTTTSTTVPDPLADVVIPPGVDPDTGVTIVDDPEAPAYLVEPTSGLIYFVGDALVLGSDITNASAGNQGQGWVVDPDFTSEGARKFEEATRQLAAFPVGSDQRRFAIVLDGEVVSAPTIAEGVTAAEGLDAGQVQITIGFGNEDPQAEAEDLATVLRYGALPVVFERSRVDSVSATLGDDSLQAGLIAGFGGLVLVALAMIAYYRALGFITVIGLTVFGSLLFVEFSLLGALQGQTLTLSGVAGVIVSVGITNDSYIVYFERIKEEVRNGRALRSAVDHAFPRAFRTILTADTVSLAGAILLYTLAAAQVRGFALALGIATVTDVIVAYFFTRPAAALVARSRFGDGGALSIRGAAGHPTVEAAS
ncbi:MAG: protein translocase subunit SecD [Acidimicrobiia bacterium]|nr:protein translocase subunit SecD [Acidimicrobiia bacterium]